MRSTFIACALTFAVTAGAQAQLGRTGRTEITNRLAEAVAGKKAEEAKTAPLDAARAALVATATNAKAELAQPVPAAQAAAEAADQQRMATALNGLSPEGKILLAQNQAPLLQAPAAPAPAPAAAPSGAPKPKPLKPEPLTEPAAPDEKQTIITGDLTYFDSGNSIAVFVGNVVVDSPQFHITCEEFEVHMRKDAKEASEADGKKPADGKATEKGKAKPAASSKPDVKTLGLNAPATIPGSADNKATAKVVYTAANPFDKSIEKAIAKGPKVVIIKHNPDGKIQIGQSRHAYYDGDTGDITLRQSPQVQDGNNLHIALEPTTVMILTQAGALNTKGRARTDLIQGDQNGQSPAGKTSGKGGTTPASKKGGLTIPGPVPGQ